MIQACLTVMVYVVLILLYSKMREQITMYRDMYEFYKDTKSKRLFVAFAEYMFEWIEPTDLKWIEKTIFNSLKIRMDNQWKKSNAWKNSHWWWRPRNTSSELSSKNNTKTTQQTTEKQEKKKIIYLLIKLYQNKLFFFPLHQLQ